MQWVTGDLFESDCRVLVNAVNCVGVAGAGLALQFKRHFPEQVNEYVAFCRAGRMRPGVVHDAALPDGRRIVSVPTKRHWRDHSSLDDVAVGLRALALYCRETGMESIAVPALGCGLGGLPQVQVAREIKRTLSDLSCRVDVYGLTDPDE